LEPKDSPQVSVVLPVFNEEGHIADEIRRITTAFDASPYSYELIVIDDGSTDASLDRLRSLDGIRLVSFPNNRGVGTARKLGTELARGEIVIWSDADMTYPNHRMPELVAQLDGFDQVVGARTSERGTHRLARFTAKWLIRKIAQYLSRTRIPDLNSGFRAFRRDVAGQFLHLFPKGFSHVTTLTMAFLANGYSIRYIDIEYRRRTGRSKFHWYRDTRGYIQQVTRMVMMWNPMRVLMPVSAILLLAGVVNTVFDTVRTEFAITTNTVLVVTAGMIIGVLGLLADLVSQMSRPANPVRPAALTAHDTDG